MHPVERSCREVPAGGSEHSPSAEPRWLSEYRDLPVYVLIGDPGAGKTTAFEQECAALGDRGVLVTARDFLTFEDRPEWHRKTLFIDGLDEVRAGALDARTPFDAIRARLDKLGRPRFRLSCRGADWLGALDRDSLAMVAQGGRVPVLSLEPLTESDVREILEHSLRVEDAGKFMEQAERQGLRELLSNPQTLGLLTKAVAAGAWPETRRETFELACRKLIGERNPEHRSATAARPVDVERSLRAAGFLCAVQIIAGKAGYALAEDEATKDFPWCGELSGENSELFASIVRTKLYKFPSSGLVAPVHLHLAEYLAARYLANRVDQSDFPVGRIFASITGTDGIVVSQLRGLSAWLATLCTSRRDFIIDRDPIGVVLYGDIRDFSVHSKSCLLENLGQYMAAHHFMFWAHPHLESPLAAFATRDMESRFREALLTADQSDKQREITGFVLDAMLYGTFFPNLRSTLLHVIRDSSRYALVRQKALLLLLRKGLLRRGSSDGEEFKMLAREIRTGRVIDCNGNLMGLLLKFLYPEVIPRPEILDYLYVPNFSGDSRDNVVLYVRDDVVLYDWYTFFWESLISSTMSAAEVAFFLDQLSSRAEVFRPILADALPGWSACLVARGLQEHWTVDSNRLYRWMGLVLGGPEMPEEKYAVLQIRGSLRTRPSLRLSLLDNYFEQCSKKEDFESCMTSVRSLLFRDRQSRDFGRWCLKKLPEAKSDQALRYLAEQALLCHEACGIPLSWTEVEKVANGNPKRVKLLARTFQNIKLSEERRRSRSVEQNAKLEEWLKFVKSNETALRKGNAPLPLLYGLGRIYQGRLPETVASTPRQRMEGYLRSDQALIDAAIEGLRLSVHHPQIPSANDIVQLYIDGKIHWLSPPVLAGLELVSGEVPDAWKNFSEAESRQFCAFHLTGGESLIPAWYWALARNRSGLVAEVLQICTSACFKSNKPGHWTLELSLQALVYGDSWVEVARASAMVILSSVPVRASKWQLVWLNMILHAALRHSNRTDFLVLIHSKVELVSMNVGTRIRWLAAGMLAKPEEFLQRLENFVNSQEKRIRHLADFFVAIRDAQFLPIPTIEFLVRHIGEFHVPHKDQSTQVTPAQKVSNLLHGLLSELVSRPTEEAANALARLSAEPKLGAWRPALQTAVANQQAARREAAFLHLDVRQTNRLLNNQQPANANDLKALTEVVLQEVSYRIRNGDTDDYLQYWNEGPDRKLEKPKYEEACRDALMSDLRQFLAWFDAEPEKHLADDARADVMVTFGGACGFAVPIEIKTNTSPDLWRAIHDQLIVKYARDPRAGGCGLYVVFWFGEDRPKQPLPPQGARPLTADELESRLRDTLSAEEARKIAVCVVDVAAPE